MFEAIEQEKSYEKYRIDSIKERKKIEPLLYIENKVVLSRSNISVISGGAKSRKTFFCRAIVKALLTGSWCGLMTGIKCKIAWFDTEQSEGHAGRVYDSIIENTGIINPIDMFALRGLSAEEMIQELDNYLLQNNPDFIIIDGIGDLIEQANDEKESTKLVNKILDISKKMNNHITLILHVNYDNPKLRGHIGSMLERKCEHTFLLIKDGLRTNVKPKLARDEDYTPFYFNISNGFPCTDVEIPYLKPLKEAPTSFYEPEQNTDLPF